MSFLSDFRLFTSCSEVHPNHAFWAGLVSLSSIIGKRVKIEMGHFDIFPNLYVVFVAPPGYRKSTALDFCGRFLEEVKGIAVSMDCSTKEALVANLKLCECAVTLPDGKPFVSTPFTILATELSEFIGPSKDGMVNFLTTIYDKRGDYTATTLKRGTELITKPNLVLLGCTTPAWITARMKDSVITDGFARRCVFIFENEEGPRIAFPAVTEEMKAAWDRCLAFAQKLKKVAGTFTWTPEARAFFKHWYDTRPSPTDPNTAGFVKNLHMQILKVAQLLALSENPDELVMTKGVLEFAIALLESILKTLPRVFEGVGRNELRGLVGALFDCVRATGGMLSEKQATVVMFAQASQAEIVQVINHAVDAGRLVRARVTTGQGSQLVLFTPERYEQYKQELEFRQSQQPTLPASIPGTIHSSMYIPQPPKLPTA